MQKAVDNLINKFQKNRRNTARNGWIDPRGPFTVFCLLIFSFCFLPSAFAQTSDAPLTVRVKDVAEIEGVRGNQLIGYGVVIGLNRTGDRVQQNIYARQTLQNLLERMGISTTVDALKPENLATVLVTATLPPFARQGT